MTRRRLRAFGTMNAVCVLLMNVAWANSYVYDGPVHVHDLEVFSYTDPWTITLDEDVTAAALTFSDADFLNLQAGISIQANTALASNQYSSDSALVVLSLGPVDVPQEKTASSLQGDWNFQNGTLAVSHHNCSVLAEGEAMGISLTDGELEFQAGTSIRVATLDLVDSTVVLKGYASSSPIQGSGAWLFIPTEGLSNGSTSSASIRVQDNAALIVGTNLGQCEGIGSFAADSLAARNTAIRQTMTKILADVDQCTTSGEATLITAASNVAVSNSILGGGTPGPLHISVGTVAVDDSAVLIGDGGRWIVYCPEYSSSISGLLVQPEVGSDATLVLYDWNPETQSDLTIPGVWTNAYIVSQYGRGRLVAGDGSMTATAVLCQDFPGLRARNLVAEVEDSTNQSDLKSLPGYRYIIDSFPVTSVGDDAYANLIDSATFMPINSGTLAASEQLHDSVAERILLRHALATDENAHWWADVFGEKRTAKNAFQGGSGNWGYKAKSAVLSLGADKRFENGWNATVAFSGMTVDTDTRGLLMGVDGKATGAVLTLQASRDGNWGRIGMQASIARIQTESTKLAIEHRLKTEPELLSAKATAFWEGECPLGESSALLPWLSVSGAYVKTSDTDVMDTTSTGLYGVGFEGEVGRRLLGQVRVGAALRGQTMLGGFGLSGDIGAYAGAAFGDTDWQMRTKLSGGSTTSSASYAAIPRWDVRFEIAVCLNEAGQIEETSGGILGIGKKSTGKLRPFDWRCELWTAYERAEYTQDAWQGGVRFQSIF